MKKYFYERSKSVSLQPIGLLIFCFVIIVFSINQIIHMATPTENIADSQKLQTVNLLLKSREPLTYKNFEQESAASFSGASLQNDFNIDSKIQNLSPDEQNYNIRLKLLEWKVSQLESQMSSSSRSVILNIWLWIYSILIWASSIVGTKILSFHTDKVIQKYWVKHNLDKI